MFLKYFHRLTNLRENLIELKYNFTPKLRYFIYLLKCDDLIELYKYAEIKSNDLFEKIKQRKLKQEYFKTIGQTIYSIIDSISSSIQSKFIYLFIYLFNK